MNYIPKLPEVPEDYIHPGAPPAIREILKGLGSLTSLELCYLLRNIDMVSQMAVYNLEFRFSTQGELQ